MKMRLLKVEILQEFEGRPRRSDVDIEDWEGPLISPSALTSYLACPRKWAFGALDGFYQPSTASQELGTQLHEQLEYWLTKGKPPLGRLTDSGALSLVPLPNTPGLECEQPFAIELSEGDRRAVLWGFRDVAAPGVVMDLKTTSSLNWAKTPEDLIADPQANIYASACMLESGLDYADLRWVYVTTKGAIESKATDVRLTKDQVTARLSTWFDAICYMSELRELKGKKAMDLAPERKACGDFGGCNFLPRCGEVEAGSGFMSLHKKRKKEETEDMGIMDKVRKDLGDWKTDEAIKNVAEVAVRETSPAVLTKTVKTSKSSLLAKVQRGTETKKTTSAEGVNAPDAKLPVATEATTEATTEAASSGVTQAAATPEVKKKTRTKKTKETEATTVEAGSLQAALAERIVVFVDCAPYKLGDANAQALFVTEGHILQAGGLYCVNSAHVTAEVLEQITDAADIVIRG